MGDLFERKLWHELTAAVADFVKKPEQQARGRVAGVPKYSHTHSLRAHD